jgi:hypothetical protein
MELGLRYHQLGTVQTEAGWFGHQRLLPTLRRQPMGLLKRVVVGSGQMQLFHRYLRLKDHDDEQEGLLDFGRQQYIPRGRT